MRLKFPTKFNFSYPKKNSTYYDGVDKMIMLNLLLDACDNYCMYCGKYINTDDKYEFNMEHSIDKKNDEKGKKNNSFLRNCKYNLSIACPSCNQKYKTRMVDDVNSDLMNVTTNCLMKSCTSPCKSYIAAFNDYVSKNKIILQPNNIDKRFKEMKIDYNLLKHTFEPSIECTNPDDRNFISEHISRFHLNKEMYTESVLETCDEILNIIQTMGGNIDITQVFTLIEKRKYDNVLKKIFINYLKEIFICVEDLKKFCEFCIILSFI